MQSTLEKLTWKRPSDPRPLFHPDMMGILLQKIHISSRHQHQGKDPQQRGNTLGCGKKIEKE